MKSFPLYSQYLDVQNKSWRHRACGIVSVKVLMEYWRARGACKRELPSIDHLFRVGINRRSFINKIGWRHTGLVGIAKLYGFKHSEAYDLADLELGKAVIELKKYIRKYPVIVSVYAKYQPGNGGHLPILFSLNKTRAILLDPDTKSREKILLKIPTQKFIKTWKKRFIVIRP